MVMAHGMKTKPGDGGSPKAGIGSRRIFPPQFKLQVLDSYRRDADCKGNQRATARKYGIHRRQIQKWLQAESNLRNSVVSSVNNNNCVLVNKNQPMSPKGDHHACLSLESQPLRQRDDASPRGSTQAALSQSPVRPVLSPAMATRTPSDRPRCPASPADIASPARAHAQHTHMPMDLSVRRPSSAAPAPPSRSTPWPVAMVSVGHDCTSSRSPSPQSSTRSRSRSRSRSPLAARTQSVIITPTMQHPSSSRPEIWDLSKSSATAAAESAFLEHKQLKTEPPTVSPVTKPLFKPYLLDDERKSPPPPHASTTTTTIGTNGSSFRGYDYVVTSTYAYTYGMDLPAYEANVDVGYVFDESGVLQPATYLRQLPFTTHAQHPPQHHPHRQTYPLDFKLRAIDTYYRDDCYKSNQRSAAFKYTQRRHLHERVEKHLQT